jgi:hypothetical protein
VHQPLSCIRETNAYIVSIKIPIGINGHRPWNTVQFVRLAYSLHACVCLYPQTEYSEQELAYPIISLCVFEMLRQPVTLSSSAASSSHFDGIQPPPPPAKFHIAVPIEMLPTFSYKIVQQTQKLYVYRHKNNDNNIS